MRCAIRSPDGTGRSNAGLGKARGDGALGSGPSGGRVFELGVSVRGRARSQRDVRLRGNRNRLVTAAQSMAAAHGHAISPLTAPVLAYAPAGARPPVLAVALR